MLIVVLSHFDAHAGPKLVFNYPKTPDYVLLDHIPLLMDFYEKGFFIHEFGDLKTANLIFTIPNPNARGSEDVLMISIVILNEKYVLKDFEVVLNIFIENFKPIKEIYLGLPANSTKFKTDPAKKTQILALVESLFESLPKESSTFKLRVTKILIYGLPQAGISTIIYNLKNAYTSQSLLRGEMSVAKAFLANISIISYSFTNKKPFSSILSIFLQEIDGLVYVLDSSDPSKFGLACEELHAIEKFPETHGLPLLVLLNKADIAVPDEKKIEDVLKLNQFPHNTIKPFAVSGIKNQGLIESFRWLTNEVSNNILRSPAKYFS